MKTKEDLTGQDGQMDGYIEITLYVLCPVSLAFAMSLERVAVCDDCDELPCGGGAYLDNCVGGGSYLRKE